MVDRGDYTLRGWLAFVSFLDFAQALRSWFDKDVFLGSYYKNYNSSTNITDTESSKQILNTCRSSRQNRTKVT